jgi:hypothetical protein
LFVALRGGLMKSVFCTRQSVLRIFV